MGEKKTFEKQLWMFIYAGLPLNICLLRENAEKNLCLVHSHTCIMAYVTTELFYILSLQPEEYGQEAMEGQGEAMLDPEGETYDESQQVIRVHKIN